MKSDHLLGHKTSLNEFQNVKIMQTVLWQLRIKLSLKVYENIRWGLNTHILNLQKNKFTEKSQIYKRNAKTQFPKQSSLEVREK